MVRREGRSLCRFETLWRNENSHILPFDSTRNCIVCVMDHFISQCDKEDFRERSDFYIWIAAWCCR